MVNYLLFFYTAFPEGKESSTVRLIEVRADGFLLSGLIWLNFLLTNQPDVLTPSVSRPSSLSKISSSLIIG